MYDQRMKIQPWHMWTGAVVAASAVAAKLAGLYYRFRSARAEARARVRVQVTMPGRQRAPYLPTAGDVRRFLSTLQDVPAEIIRLRNTLSERQNTHLVFQLEGVDDWAMVPTASVTLIRRGGRDFMVSGNHPVGLLKRGGAMATCMPRDFEMAVGHCTETMRAAEEAEDTRLGCSARGITLAEYTKLPKPEQEMVRIDGRALRTGNEAGNGLKESDR